MKNSADLPPSGFPAIVDGSRANFRACIIFAYPSRSGSHGARLLETVEKSLKESSVQYDIIDLYAEGFNPVMRDDEVKNYGKSLQDDVLKSQARLRSSEAWIFLYPVWWSAPPAILKGWIDRVFTPEFAFEYDKGAITPLLGGKRALVIRTFGGSALLEEKNDHLAEGFMDKAVLGACGVRSVSQDIYSTDTLAPSLFEHILFQVAGATRRVIGRPTGVPHHLRSISAPYLPPIERREKLPIDADGEEKPELSEEARADLAYFQSARRQARAAVHAKADAREGGRHGQRQDFRQGNRNSWREAGEISGFGQKSQKWKQKEGRQGAQTSGFVRTGEGFFGRKPSGQKAPSWGGGKKKGHGWHKGGKKKDHRR